MENFFISDKKLILESLSKKDIINSLTLEDVENFLDYLQIPYQRKKDFLICPTVCHNRLEEAESMKLYYYSNYHVFHCYTECNESMTIFEFYKKFMAVNYSEISDEEATQFVFQFLTKIAISSSAPQNKRVLIDREKYYREKTFLLLEEYSPKVLDCFLNFHHPSWIKEGISEKTMDKFNIRFSNSENRIIIPHKDISGRIVGIRARALEEEDVVYGKYKPEKVGNVLYTHNLSYNLYGIFEHKKAIQKFKRAVIVESEKSVMLDDTYFGENSTAVACCGSNINKYQIWLLVHKLGVNEIVIALDKEYENWLSEEAKKYRKKLVEICEKYSYCVKMSYIFDRENLIGRKDAPHDRGKEVYEKLLKDRIDVKHGIQTTR